MQAIKIIIFGVQAISNIEGLRSLILQGIFAIYLIFLCFMTILNYFFYSYFLNPITDWIFGVGEGFFASLGNFILWSIQFTVSAIIALISLCFSVVFMNVWNKSLVSKILENFGKNEKQKISIKTLWNEAKVFFIEVIKACIYPILMIFLSLIPLIGMPIVFLMESHLLGKQSTIVYIECLTNINEIAYFKKKWRWLPIRIGWLPAILTFIPIIGWLLLPLTITFQVIGLAYSVAKSSTN